MFVVIFEVQPKTEQFDRYLELAKMLRPELERIDGFIDNERFRSTTHPERILSLSSWRDEKALIRWRTLAIHHRVQEEGRLRVFQNYRLRVGEVRLDTLPPPGLPIHEQRFDVTESSLAKTITITEISPSAKPNSTAAPEPYAPDMIESDVFESIYTPGKSWCCQPGAIRLPLRHSHRNQPRRAIVKYESFEPMGCMIARKRRNITRRWSYPQKAASGKDTALAYSKMQT